MDFAVLSWVELVNSNCVTSLKCQRCEQTSVKAPLRSAGQDKGLNKVLHFN